MKTKLLALVMLLMAACQTPSTEQTQTPTDSVLKADQLLDTFESVVDKEVSFAGTVVHVCKHGGKKLHVVGTDGERRIVVHASDATGVFDQQMEGSEVRVRGTVKETRIDENSLNEREQEFLANHKGEEQTEDYKAEMEYIANMREEVKNCEKGYLSRFRIEASKVDTKQ